MIDNAQLWLLRHGTAADKSPSNSYEEDFVRPLTTKGVRQSINAGKLLRTIAPDFHACYTSARVRCVQTAVLACQELKGVKPKTKKELLEISNSEAVGLIKDSQAVLLVGHGPEFNNIVAHLTGRVVDLSRGTVAEIHVVNNQGELATLLTPKQIASMV
jgi:phosphohistidine phosphatase SixA